MVRKTQRTSSQDLREIILGPTKGRYFRPTESFDEVYPGIFIGDAATALSTCLLKELGVTHVINAAHGKNDRYNYGYVNTSISNYDQAGIKLLAIQAMDSPAFYLRPYFHQAADFIDEALKNGGKVLSHCLAGISRSATLVAAYLMIKKGMSVEEAISTIRARRSVFPNDGFLSQLSDFDYELKNGTKRGSLGNSKNSILEKPEEKETHTISTYRLGTGMPRTTNPYKEVTRSGFPLTSFYYDVATKSRTRARSEDRSFRPYYDSFNRARSVSPPPSVYRARAVSLLPDEEDSYSMYQPRATSVAPRVHLVESKFSTTPVLTSYQTSGIIPSQTYYYTRTKGESYPYSSRLSTRPLTTTYLKSRYPAFNDNFGSLSRTLTPRDKTITSSAPYESYSYYTPYSSRSYTNYTRSDGPISRIQPRQSVPPKLKYSVLFPATYRHINGLKVC